MKLDFRLGSSAITAAKWRNFTSRRSAALARLSAVYSAFAVLSAAVNLGVQWSTVRLATSFHLLTPKLLVFPALVICTGAGLALKYTLDKRYIFRSSLCGKMSLARNFGLYSVMSLATTGLFWGTELLTCLVSSDPRAIYLGGGLGLSVGYLVKYNLDRRFVFNQTSD